MCKQLILTNISLMSKQQLYTLLINASRIMGKTDSHGFGYALLNGQKHVGERCLDPMKFKPSLFNSGVPKSFRSIFESSGEYGSESNNFGNLPNLPRGGLLVHTRISTNVKSIANTHPLIKGDWALIHNGVVTDHGPNYVRETSNDTEHLVQHLSTGSIKAIEEYVSGYYSFGALNKATGELRVVKDNTAQLFGCYVKELKSMAFGTSADQLAKILKKIAVTHSKIEKVKDNTSMLFDINGKLVSQEVLNKRETSYGHFSDWQLEQSMGIKSSSSTNTTMLKPYTRYSPERSSYYSSNYGEDIGEYENDWERKFVKDNARRPSDKEIIERYAEKETKTVVDDDTSGTDMIYDFLDAEGNELPGYKIDELFTIFDTYGREITSKEFLSLQYWEQENCEVVDKQTGEAIGRVAY